MPPPSAPNTYRHEDQHIWKIIYHGKSECNSILSIYIKSSSYWPNTSSPQVFYVTKNKKKKTLRKTAQFLWWEINAMQWVHNKWTGMQGKKYKSNIWYFGIPGTASTMWRLLAASFQNWENLAVWRWKQRNIIKISVLSLYANSDIQPKYMVSRPNEYAVKKKKHTSK